MMYGPTRNQDRFRRTLAETEALDNARYLRLDAGH